MILVVAALAAFFVVQFIKQIWPKTVPPAIKMVLVVALTLACSLWRFGTKRPDEAIIYAAAAAGLSIAVHRVVRLLIVLGDRTVRQTLRDARRGPG
jgi:branched-subunit amino acid ABC-type transport system permease component